MRSMASRDLRQALNFRAGLDMRTGSPFFLESKMTDPSKRRAEIRKEITRLDEPRKKAIEEASLQQRGPVENR